MIRTQSLTSQRQSAVQVTTGMIQSQAQAASSVVRNVR
jgi:hypothetical protein